MGTASTFLSMVNSLVERQILLDLESKGIWTVAPRNLVVRFPMKCMGWSWRCSFESYVFAIDARKARLWHLGTFLHSTPVLPPFYALQQLLTALRPITDEAGIICILVKVDGSLSA